MLVGLFVSAFVYLVLCATLCCRSLCAAILLLWPVSVCLVVCLVVHGCGCVLQVTVLFLPFVLCVWVLLLFYLGRLLAFVCDVVLLCVGFLCFRL